MTTATIPVCSSSKINIESSSAEIDDQVKSIVSNGLSVYRVDSELLDHLSPSVIITQTQCEVCAVSLRDVEEAVGRLVTSSPKIVSLEPVSLSDVWSDIYAVASALGDSERGVDLVSKLNSRLESLRIQTQQISCRPTVACVEWIDPLMIVANWVPTLVDYAGGINLLSEPGSHSGYLSVNELYTVQPDVIIIMPCGFNINRSIHEMTSLTKHPQWRTLRAVQNGRVYVTDGNQYFNRPGPRLVESAEILAECLHFGKFNFGHRGTGWIALDAT